MTSSPDPIDRDPVGGGNQTDSSEWIERQLSQLTKTPEDYVESGYATYVERYANKMQKEATETVEKEIARDMIKWHVQPSIMEHYRRFVVVKSPRDSQKRTYEDGVSIYTRDYRLPLTPTSRSNGELCGSSISKTASDPPPSITDLHTSHLILEAALYLANQL